MVKNSLPTLTLVELSKSCRQCPGAKIMVLLIMLPIHLCIQVESELYPILETQGVLAKYEEVSSPILQSEQY